MTEPDFDAQLQAFKRFVLQTLKAANIAKAEILYDGAGTNADIEEVNLGDTPFPQSTPITMPAHGECGETRTWISLSDLLHNFATDVVALHHNPDNEEDAFGTITLDVQAAYVTLERCQKIVHSETVEV